MNRTQNATVGADELSASPGIRGSGAPRTAGALGPSTIASEYK